MPIGINKISLSHLAQGCRNSPYKRTDLYPLNLKLFRDYFEIVTALMSGESAIDLVGDRRLPAYFVLVIRLSTSTTHLGDLDRH